jgi:hypothetical protein
MCRLGVNAKLAFGYLPAKYTDSVRKPSHARGDSNIFNLIKTGHVLRFGTCPSSIVSPPGANSGNDNTQVTLWPNASNLGLVQCISHPSGALSAIAADVATHLRAAGSVSQSASYSALGRAVTASDRPIGQVNSDFVGYTDGKSFYINSTNAVMSKDFSGCLFASYSVGGQRRVAHVAASQVAHMNCKQGFLTTIQGQGAILHGWFRPFVDANDGARRFAAFQRITRYVNGNPYAITTFGAFTAGNQAYSIDAFKPAGIPGNNWVVTHVAAHPLSQSFVAP